MYKWPTLRVQITDTEKDIADITTDGCSVDIPSECNNCRWMHPSIAVECNDSANLRLKFLFRFAGLPQMWQFTDFLRFADF